MVHAGIAGWPREHMAVVGSSLGGFYATWVAEQTGCRAVLLNPAVHPARDLAQVHRRADQLARPAGALFLPSPSSWTNCAPCDCAAITRPERYFAVIAKGDEVLDWREMTARYPGAQVRLLEGSDHAISEFADHLDDVLAFLDLRLSLSHRRHDRREPWRGMGQSPPCLHCLKKPENSWPAVSCPRPKPRSQVELESGKRVKVKAANVLLKFEKPAPAELLGAAQALSQSIELELAWEFAPEDEFGFADLASVYFQDPPTLPQQAGALLRLQEAPHYFRRAGKGRFKKAPAEIIAAGAGRHREKTRDAAADRRLGRRPWAAASARSRSANSSTRSCSSRTRTRPSTRPWSRPRAPPTLRRWTCCKRPAPSTRPTSSTGGASCSRTSPRATAFPRSMAPEIRDELPLAAVQAFSIDDSATTEIDDALSVQGLGSGHGHGRHPHRGTRPGRAARQPGRQRGPRTPVHRLHAGLQDHHAARRGGAALHPAGRARLPGRLALRDARRSHAGDQGHETRLERVPIAHNLRHDQLDTVVTEPSGCKTRRSSIKTARQPLSQSARSSYHFYTAWPST